MTTTTLLLAGAGDLALRTGRLFMQDDARVIGLRRRPPAGADDGIAWMAADLGDPSTLSGLPGDITHVLYAASPDAGSEAAYRRIFIDGLRNVCERLQAATLRRIVFVSSTAVYGSSQEIIDEDTPAQPEHFNGRVLLEAEQWLHRRHPHAAVSLRLSGLYGPGRTGLLTRLADGTASVPDGGGHWANRIHIDDAARACAHLLKLPSPEPRYIGTDGQPWRIDALYDALAQALDAPVPLRHRAPEAASGKRLSNARLRASGFEFLWPDALEGYRPLIQNYLDAARS
ncbi:MAG: NAD-dependent epimerase/dehydratase family protein [Candidimonas sp.]